MSTIDQQFVEYIVKSLVSKPDDVVIERTIDERGVLLKLTVADDDLGRVIGKRGSTAQSIRTLLRALGTKNDARYNLKIVDPMGGVDSGHKTSDEKSVGATENEPTTVVDAKQEVNNLESADKEAVIESHPAETADNSLADKTRKELAELDDLDI